MNYFCFTYKKELTKLLYKKKYYILTIIGFIFTLIRVGGGFLITKLSGGAVTVKSNMALEMLPFVIELLVPIIILIAVSELFTHEISADTMKLSLTQPITRFKLLTAKSLAAITVGAMATVALGVLNIILQIILSGSPDNVFASLLAYIIDIIPLIGVAFLGVIINVNLKAPSSATLLSLAVYGIFKYMGLYVSGASSFLFTSMARFHILFLGKALPLHIILSRAGVLFGSILILYSISYIIFDRRNF